MGFFVQECNRCRKPIEMSDKEGRWLPFNENGNKHICNNDSRRQTK